MAGMGADGVFVIAVMAVAVWLGDEPIASLLVIGVLTSLFLLIVARTTKGGWRWRWGEKQ